MTPKMIVKNQKVMEFLALGMTMTEIARQLGVTVAAVSAMVRQIKKSCGARTVLQAAVMWSREQPANSSGNSPE